MVNEKILVTRLREALKQTTESNSEIAQDIGMSRQGLWKFKTGQNQTMKGMKLQRLAERLGVSTKA